MTPWTLTADSGGRYLVPHPWDVLGEPPTPGYAYGIVAEVAQLRADLERLVDEADDLAEEADRLEEEADETRRRSDEADKKAGDVCEELSALGFGDQARAVRDGKGWPE